jgi:A/G-specific adenine glycosylase
VLARRGTRLLLEKRPPTGLWGGLWGFPEFPTRAHAIQWCADHLARPSAGRSAEPLRHAFSHFDYAMRPIVVDCAGEAPALRDEARYRWYDTTAPCAIGVPTPVATLLQRAAEDVAA